MRVDKLHKTTAKMVKAKMYVVKRSKYTGVGGKGTIWWSLEEISKISLKNVRDSA